MQTRLSHLSSGRDNNLNLVRMVAAVAVLVSHAWPITMGDSAVEPLMGALGISLGTAAVYVFFVISGFLIAASYERSSSPARFLVARGLRLFPGLLVSLLLVALVIGPLATTLPVQDYLTDPGVWTFLARNLALVQPQYTLPGVFENTPYGAVEGSIWTLIHEVGCYGGIFILGTLGLLGQRRAMAWIVTLYALAWVGYLVIRPELHPKVADFWRLSLPFAIGTALYIWQRYVPLSLWLAAGLTTLAWATKGTDIYRVTLILALAYGTVWLAYVPGGWLRRYNWLGDYSYGLYIYAFPVQVLAVWLFGPMSPQENIALALPLTLLPAVLSWHIVEKPALGCRRRIVARLELNGALAGRVAPVSRLGDRDRT